MTVFAILALLIGILSVILTGLLCINLLILINGIKIDERSSTKLEIRRKNNAPSKGLK